MSFQIHALPAQDFTAMFAMSDAALAQRNACRVAVTESSGTPCRVSLADAEVGETVLLLNHQHQPAQSPYQASHAIFVREGVPEAKPARMRCQWSFKHGSPHSGCLMKTT